MSHCSQTHKKLLSLFVFSSTLALHTSNRKHPCPFQACSKAYWCVALHACMSRPANCLCLTTVCNATCQRSNTTTALSRLV
ncbi:hypothetical protein DUNSADRAFT_1946 [Dunaliella salina]|uniref:Secreted protein n=1 Tax=Dunaliella salina TaxID=3046 RepID=A0ABQ7GWG2_DUNSA|nr:hypothetical protein DUNSADRAFT_1946 [Dunaliella salina]|eukprot:KAF5838930.1 hypothetical protein DUNSADRAFT_1946 [Dunaliella salina]